MKIGYELTIEQTQKLSMTPELIQAIQILQYNNQELNEYIDKELLENPILESEYHKESDTEIDPILARGSMNGNIRIVELYVFTIFDKRKVVLINRSRCPIL